MARQLLETIKTSKGDLQTSAVNAGVGTAVGVVHQALEDSGRVIMGRPAATEVIPAIELAGGLALQFQKNGTLRSLGQTGILIGSYELGKNVVSPNISGMTRKFKKTHRETVPRGGSGVSSGGFGGTMNRSLYA